MSLKITGLIISSWFLLMQSSAWTQNDTQHVGRVSAHHFQDSVIEAYLNNTPAHDSLTFSEAYAHLNTASPHLAFDLTMHGVTMGFFQSQTEGWEKCIAYLRNTKPLDTISLAKSLNYGGGAWHKAGDIENAKTYFLEVIELLPPDLIDEELAVAHNNLGAILDNHNDPGAAYANYNKARDIFKALLGPDHYYLGVLGNNMGQSLNRLERFNEQIEIQERSLDILLNEIGENHSVVGNLYINLGIVYRQTKQFDKSMASFRAAIRVRENLGDNAGLIAAQSEIAQLMAADTEQYSREDVIAQQRRAIGLADELLGENNKAVISLHNNLALALLGGGNLEDALYHVQRATELNYDIKPNSESLYPLPTMEQIGLPNFRDFQLFENKGHILFRLYEQTDSAHFLSLSCQSFTVGDSVLDRLRVELINGMSRKWLIKQAADYYINATRSAIKAFRVTSDITYLEQGFTWIEKSRNWEVMTMYMAGNHIASVEDSFLANIRELRSMLPSAYQSKMNQPVADSLNSLIDIEIAELQRHHPEYFDLLYGFEPVTLSEVRRYCSENNVNWLHFLPLPGMSFDCLMVTPDTTMLLPLPGNMDSLRMHEDNLMSAIERRDWSFATHSIHLYNALLAPYHDMFNDRPLQVSSGGLLAGIPFDVLMPEDAMELAPDELTEYFLINRIHISRVPSATYGLRLSDRITTASSAIFIAPDYLDETLQSSLEEVVNASTILNGHLLKGNISTIAFEEGLRDYDIVHFAGHSYGHDTNPDSTYLVLGQGHDSLFLSSMLAGESRAKLAVLSSCLSARGVQQFEGRLGLTYAFAFMGTPNVISSMWEVPDRESSSIFSRFYQHMSEGIPSTESLRKAKLEYLNESALPGKHPYYWAGWTVNGNAVQFRKAGISPYVYLIGLVLLAVVIAVAYRPHR